MTSNVDEDSSFWAPPEWPCGELLSRRAPRISSSFAAHNSGSSAGITTMVAPSGILSISFGSVSRTSSNSKACVRFRLNCSSRSISSSHHARVDGSELPTFVKLSARMIQTLFGCHSHMLSATLAAIWHHNVHVNYVVAVVVPPNGSPFLTHRQIDTRTVANIAQLFRRARSEFGLRFCHGGQLNEKQLLRHVASHKLSTRT